MISSIEITIGFTVSDQSVKESDETVTLEVFVVAGSLQRSVSIGYETLEMTSGKIATGKFFSKSTDTFLYHVP